MKRIVITLIIMLMISSILININSYAGSVKQFDGNIDGAEDSATTVRKFIGAVLNIVRMVGAAVAISMLMIIACKYIIASAGDKADVKKYAVNYIIGALILFGASGILTIIQKFVIEGLLVEE